MSTPTSGRGPRRRQRAVPRLRALGVTVLLLLAIVGMTAGVGLLRVTDMAPTPTVDIATIDPRTPVECPGLQPREGVERDDPATFSRLPVVTISSGDVLDCPEYYDGRRVIYRGEAVGQVLGLGARAWLQVNDDAYASGVGPLPAHRFYLGGNSGLGVHALAADLEAIRWRGGPTAHGDQVEVHGIFHRTEPGTGEIGVIAARRIVVLAEGALIERVPSRDRQVVAYLLCAVAVGLGLLQRRRSRR